MDHLSDPRPLAKPGRIALLLLFVMLLCVFTGLAAWQVERRAWKHALIERVEQRVHRAAIDAPGQAGWPLVTAADDEYRHVRATGRFVPGRETFVRAATVLGSGYWLIAPFRLADGSVILVNRGYVASNDRSRVVAAGDETLVTGLLRITEPGGSFIQHNDPALDRWYSRDVEAIARARGLRDVAPYFIDAEGDPANAGDGGVDAASRGIPVGGLTVVSFSDNHLLYAIIWGILALMNGWAAGRILRVP
ncbi:MAG: SURF1 family protein [Burkholderiaceae bacterium]